MKIGVAVLDCNPARGVRDVVRFGLSDKKGPSCASESWVGRDGSDALQSVARAVVTLLVGAVRFERTIS